MFMPIAVRVHTSLDVLVDCLYLVVNPFVNVGSSDIPQENEGSFKGVPHGVNLLVQAIIDLPFGYETFHFGLIPIKDIRFLSDEAIATLVFISWLSSWISPSSRVSRISPPPGSPPGFPPWSPPWSPPGLPPLPDPQLSPPSGFELFPLLRKPP